MTFTHPKDAPEGHKWQTRDGREVRIYAWDHGGGYPIAGATATELGWAHSTWTKSGHYFDLPDECTSDLIDAPRKHVRWVNVYPGDGGVHRSRDLADTHAAPSTRLACIRIEFEEGEGL